MYTAAKQQQQEQQQLAETQVQAGVGAGPEAASHASRQLLPIQHLATCSAVTGASCWSGHVRLNHLMQQLAARARLAG